MLETQKKIQYYIYEKEAYYKSTLSGKMLEEKWLIIAILNNVKDLTEHIWLKRLGKKDLKIRKKITVETFSNEIVLGGISKYITYWKLKLLGLLNWVE